MIRVFDYLPELDAFVVSSEYKQVADGLGLTEWHETVWIGRYLTLDNDYGEHFFDNWDLREERQAKAEAIGIDSERLMVVDPERFQNGKDGPCHTDEERKRFWTDVLQSLHLSWDTLVAEATKVNQARKDAGQSEASDDLEKRIERMQKKF